MKLFGKNFNSFHYIDYKIIVFEVKKSFFLYFVKLGQDLRNLESPWIKFLGTMESCENYYVGELT